MKNMLHVTVMFQDIIWDQFLISSDHMLFIKFNSKCTDGDVADLELLERNVSITSQYKGATIVKPHVDSTQYSVGQDILTDKVKKLDISAHVKGDSDISQEESKLSKYVHNLYVNGYLLSLFVKTVQQSVVYRRSVVANFKEYTKRTGTTGMVKINMKLVCPRQNVIDFAWNERLGRLAVERRELDNAMSWLSTLGGAFSALGEEFKHCAEIAGRISVQQFGIALRLGDPLTVARCKLYFALSLIQRGHLTSARHIIRQQYCLAHLAPVVDTRLISMCLGIWAKLKYEYHKRKPDDRRK